MKSNPQAPATLFQDIAPARAMQISVSSYSNEGLELAAPLQPNINDKGTAFAGSISSLLVLAGWGVITLRLRDAGIPVDVVVSKSEIDYKRPVCGEMHSNAEIGSEQVDPLISYLAENPCGSIQIQSRLLSEGRLCATMVATYVVFPKTGKK
jgi:thioesterase domain-containing protein